MFAFQPIFVLYPPWIISDTCVAFTLLSIMLKELIEVISVRVKVTVKVEQSSDHANFDYQKSAFSYGNILWRFYASRKLEAGGQFSCAHTMAFKGLLHTTCSNFVLTSVRARSWPHSKSLGRSVVVCDQSAYLSTYLTLLPLKYLPDWNLEKLKTKKHKKST